MVSQKKLSLDKPELLQADKVVLDELVGEQLGLLARDHHHLLHLVLLHVSVELGLVIKLIIQNQDSFDLIVIRKIMYSFLKKYG